MDTGMVLAECQRALAAEPELWRSVERTIVRGEPLGDSLPLARVLVGSYGERGVELMREVHRIGMRTPLRRLRDLYRATPRWRARREAARQLTDSYVDLLFAWGFRRAGFDAEAAALVDEAARTLPARDPVHRFLVRAFRHRIETALDPPAPLPKYGTNAWFCLSVVGWMDALIVAMSGRTGGTVRPKRVFSSEPSVGAHEAT